MLAKLFKKKEPQPNLSRLELDARPFWEGLPSLGSDTEDIIGMIKRAYPVPVTFRDPYRLRRQLYGSILRFRTDSNRPWLLDEKVVKFDRKPSALNRALPMV